MITSTLTLKQRKKETHNAEIPFGGGGAHTTYEKEKTVGAKRFFPAILYAIFMSTLSMYLHIFPLNRSTGSHFTVSKEVSIANVDSHDTPSIEKSLAIAAAVFSQVKAAALQPQVERHVTPECRPHPTKCDGLCETVSNFIRKNRFGVLKNPKTWSHYYQGVLEYYRCTNAKKIVEVGVAWGAQTAYHLKNGMDFIDEYHVVDPFMAGYDPDDPMSQQFEKAAPGSNPQQISDAMFQGMAMDLGRDGMYLPGDNEKIDPPPVCRLRMHHLKSVDGAKLFGDLSVDAVFIDGLHTYEGVMDDINAWMSKIKVGGSLIFNDFSSSKFGVNKAVWEVANKLNLKIKMIDNTNAILGGLESCAKGPPAPRIRA